MAFKPVGANQIEIGTTATTADPPVWTYSKLCKGIESMTFASNEQNQQYFFICGEGFAHNEVTGAAPELQVSGRRIAGDAAQDYIVGKQFAIGTARNSSVKITTAEGKVITCDCSIGDVVSFGGNTLDVLSFGCTIRFNGKPVVTDAA
ncbi:MAG: hypothetical protein J6Q65_07720 [Lentisphaeria bacterium]|nr:hypothetical protein [Lentisphaeria bacterium]